MIKCMKVHMTVLLIVMSCIMVNGQKKYSLQFYHEVSQKPVVTKVVDSIAIQKLASDHYSELAAGGYTFATLDTIIYKGDTCKVYFFKGQKYHIGKIKFTAEQSSILEEAGIRSSDLNGKAIDSVRIIQYLNSILSHLNNNGYPFAQVSLSAIHLKNSTVDASLKTNYGKKIIFDSIRLEGRLDMSPKFFSRLLDIKVGDLYDHEKVVRASSRIRDLQYIKQREDPFVRFINDKAILVLTPDPKPASRFDFLIGVLPTITNGVRKWNLSVDFTAELNNAFRHGEYSYIQVKKLKPENLELQLKSTIPYVFNLPIGTHADFRLFKNASTNIDLYFDGGFQYLFGGYNQIRIFGSYRSSRLIEIKTEEIIQSSRLPSSLDLSYSGAGISLNIRQLDYRFNPTKGYNGEFTAILGTKNILPNRQILSLENFASSYDSLTLHSLQTELNGHFSYFFKVKDWATIRSALTGGWKYNKEGLLTNELMRIGGSKLLRGFDEESIFTDFYAFSTLEFRIIFDQNSYLSLPFLDYGFLNVFTNGQHKTVPVFGVGMGLNFGTSAGIFNISFAAGKLDKNPLDFGRMKIHFGYVNLF